MKRLLLSLILAAGLAATAMAGVTTILNGVSAASGSSGPVNTSGARTLNVMVIGDGLTGVVTISQGPDASSLAATKVLTLDTYTGKTEYYVLQPSTITQVDYTRSAGTLTVKLEWYQ